MASPEEAVLYRTQGRIAIITLNQPKKLNAMTQPYYYRISCLLRDIAANPDISVTVITGSGRFFSAGANVTTTRPGVGPGTDKDAARGDILRSFVSNNLDITRSFYTHPKILVTALNGPVVGIAAALVACSDFIYCLPHTYLLTPFSSLGLVAEGASSLMLARRMGVSKAKEALIMSRKISADELLACGFDNKVFNLEVGNTEKFMEQVLQELDDRVGPHLNDSSMLHIKSLMSAHFQREVDAQNVAELFRNLERQVAGIPQKEFEKLRTGKKRHKL